MPRPKCRRWVGRQPDVTYFKPRGIPLAELDEIVITVDELEAIRLADLEGLYQTDAAERMHVSRQTFGRIVESARRKVAEVLVTGKALKIDGGTIDVSAVRRFACFECGHSWRIRHGKPRPSGCPSCRSEDVHWKSRRRSSEHGPQPEGGTRG